MRAVDNGHVMFDLTDTVFADSTGIGALIPSAPAVRASWAGNFIWSRSGQQVESALEADEAG